MIDNTKNNPIWNNISELSYEDAFSELESIVHALESGDHPLEESIGLFEKGQLLAKRCNELLDQAELKISAITGERMKLNELLDK